MIDELKELNEKFFQLYARLDRYIEKLSDEQVKIMQEKLLEQYELEYQLLSLSCDIETKREIERLTALQELLIPAKWKTRIFRRKRQNYAQTLVDESVALEAQEFYEKCERELAERYPTREPVQESEAHAAESPEEAPKPLEETQEEKEPVQESTEGTALPENPATSEAGVRADEPPKPEETAQESAETDPVTGEAGKAEETPKGDLKMDEGGKAEPENAGETEPGIDAVEIL